MDQISQLPDEILIAIISLLPLREATATSVLSRRWNDLWKYVTVLNFDGSNMLDDVDLGRIKSYDERSKFASWVNHVFLTSHRGSTIAEFSVSFSLQQRSKFDIDRWLEMAFAKNLQRLVLDFKPHSSRRQHSRYSEFYRFPSTLVFRKSASSIGNLNFKSLTTLCLRNVNVIGQVLERLLLECPLETLSVEGSQHLTNLRVAGSSLKYLKIYQCYELSSFEISAASNLVSLAYAGPQISMSIKNVPSLAEADFGSRFCCQFLTYASSQLASCFPQLEVLTLRTYVYREKERFHIPMLPMLKRLVLDVCDYHDGASLLRFTLLIEAAPHLREFALMFRCFRLSTIEGRIRKVPSHPHKNLKIVKIIGYVGGPSDTELLQYLLESATMLEKVVINPCHPVLRGRQTKQQQVARCRAMMLESILPPGAKLIIR